MTIPFETYKRLFDDSPVPMYIYAGDSFEFIAVNNASLQQYGYTREEFLSLDATCIRPVRDVASFKAANVKVPDSYFDFGHWRHIRKNLEAFYVQIYAYATEFEGKKVTIVMAIDVDQKVKVEKKLSEKNAEIVGILESITDGFYALNDNWEITYINRTAERVLCCKREDAIGKIIWDYFPQARERRFYNEYHRAMTERVSIQFEEYYDPLSVWGAISIYPTRDGIAVFFADITEQKQIQEKIYNDDQNLRAIIDNTNDAIWSIDRNHRILSSNTAFRETLKAKYGIEEAVLKHDDFGEETFAEWKAYYQRAFAGEAFKIVRTEGNGERARHKEISFNPIRNKQKEVIGISCFARDITEQYLHLQRIEKQNEQLRKIAWVQSHELRLPVANILGLSSLLDAKKCGDCSSEEVLKLMIHSTRQLDQIIRKITNYTNEQIE